MEGHVERACDSSKELSAVAQDKELLLRWSQLKETQQLGSDWEMARLLFTWYESCRPSQWYVECVCCRTTLCLSLVCGQPHHTHTPTVSVSTVPPSITPTLLSTVPASSANARSRTCVEDPDILPVRSDASLDRETVDESVQPQVELAADARPQDLFQSSNNTGHMDCGDEDDGASLSEPGEPVEAEPGFGQGQTDVSEITSDAEGKSASVSGKDMGANSISGMDVTCEQFFQCQHCDFKFPSPDTLSAHVNTVHQIKEYSQWACLKVRDEVDTLKNRVSGESVSGKGQTETRGSKPHCCGICQKRFKSSVTLRVHQTKFHSNTKLRSKKQNNVVSCEADLDRLKAKEKPLTCPDCGLAFKNTDDLCSHQKLAHSHTLSLVQAENKHTLLACDLCPKSFRSKKSLTSHMKSHAVSKALQQEAQEDCREESKSLQTSTSAVTDLIDSAQSVDTQPTHHSKQEHTHAQSQFSCSICERKFKSKRGLQGHKQREHHHSKQGLGVNRCEQCEAVFRFKSQLSRHKLSHKDDRAFSCGQCGAKFKSSSSLSLHRSWHEDMRSAVCHLCGQSCLGMRALSRHINMQHGSEHMVDKPHRCGDCTASFSSLSKLTAHAGVHSGQRNYLCQQCGQAFCSQHILDVHTRRHTGERPFQCGSCDERFIDRSGLKRHELQHQTASQQLCHVCGAPFPSKAHLAFHLQRHTSERRFSCSQCGKAYKTTGDLKSHMLSHSQDRPFSCPHCSYAARTQAMLNKHARKHTGERPYKCQQCSAAFAYFSCLAAHRKLHSNSKPFVCPVCSAAFFTAYNLRLHSRKHSGEKPYACPLCPQAFSWHSGLKCHMKKHQ